MTVDEAILKLFRIGIVAELVNDSKTRILGGTAKKTELGFNVYSNPFVIYGDRNDWVLTISGPGQFDTIEKLETLDVAVDRLDKIYRNRQ